MAANDFEPFRGAAAHARARRGDTHIHRATTSARRAMGHAWIQLHAERHAQTTEPLDDAVDDEGDN